MAEPPFKRTRRPDSKQMWDEQDRRSHPAPLPSRERDEPRREDRRDDRRGEDRRRYRSRSPRRDDRDRDRGGRRDDRDSRDSRGGRPGGWRDDDRNRNRDRDSFRDRGMYAPADLKLHLSLRARPDSVAREDRGRVSRDKPKERSQERRLSRSRSPRRERARDERRDAERDLRREDREKSKSLKHEDEYTKSRTSTPPVSFKVGASGAQDHDRMEDEGSRKGKAQSVEDTVEEEEDEIVIEDDGMAAMQAMMGFGGFGTTHERQVAGNDISAVRKEKKTEYRQYMNRVGGFNRPLSPTRED